MTTSARLPAHFISHGAGPWPYMKQDWLVGAHAHMEQALLRLPASLPSRPRALLMVSAHWEADAFTLMTHPQPPMLYDYGGFPPHTYQVAYPAPGAPGLAERAHGLLRAAGLPVARDAQRGFDHGSFVPLGVAFPAADIPLFQLSLQVGFDPAAHLEAGRALAPLRDEGVLILGSGMSYHNQRGRGPGVALHSRRFDDWLAQALQAEPAARWSELARWATAPSAREAHPREEHFMPLLVALGAAWEEQARRSYHEEGYLGGAVLSAYQFG